MSRSLLSFMGLIMMTVLLLVWHSIGANILHLVSFLFTFLMHNLNLFIHGHFIRRIIVVIFLPLLLGLIPAFLYWIVRRQWLYSYMTFVWCIWIILMTLIIIQ